MMPPYEPAVRLLTSVDLASEIKGMNCPELKLQLTTYEAGMGNRPHSHEGRVEVVYILQGAIVDHRGNVAKEYKQGDSFFANKDTHHWMENKGPAQALLLVAMVWDKK